MPWRISWSCSTSTVNGCSTPQAFRICVADAEKPHMGICGEPFMYSTTGWETTCWRMVSWAFMGILRLMDCSNKIICQPVHASALLSIRALALPDSSGDTRNTGEIGDADDAFKPALLQQFAACLGLIVPMFK